MGRLAPGALCAGRPPRSHRRSAGAEADQLHVRWAGFEDALCHLGDLGSEPRRSREAAAAPAACSRWMSGSAACPSRGSRDEPSGEARTEPSRRRGKTGRKGYVCKEFGCRGRGAGVRLAVEHCDGRRSTSRRRAGRGAGLFRALGQGREILPVAEESGPLPDRRRQRLRRQCLAHSNDQDRQGLCGGSRDRQGPEGIQGRLGRHRHGRAARRGGGLHQSGLRRRPHRPEHPDRLGPRRAPRQSEGHDPDRFRQPGRHQGHGRRRPGPDGDGRARRQLAGQERRPQGPYPRNPRRSRLLRRQGAA